MTVIPDSIEAVEGWRSWRFERGRLCSLNGAHWAPREALKAQCPHPNQYFWDICRRGGMSLEQAQQHAAHANTHPIFMTYITTRPTYVTSPSVELPPGYGYALRTLTHEAPAAGCTCGIYAAITPDICPTGDVLGKVKLWGTVIPGERGFRAEFAYPSELHVPQHLADDAAAYGVPIVVVDQELDGHVDPSRRPRRDRWLLAAAVAANLGAAAFNLARSVA